MLNTVAFLSMRHWLVPSIHLHLHCSCCSVSSSSVVTASAASHSPVNFLAVKNISEELEKNGFRRLNPQEPLGKVVAGDKFFVTKNDSSIYAFQIGKKALADAGFHMICAHCDSPTFRIKPNAEMTCEGGIVKLNTEVYGGPIMSTWFDRPLTLEAEEVTSCIACGSCQFTCPSHRPILGHVKQSGGVAFDCV